MSKKRTMLVKVATFMLAIAPIAIESRVSPLFIGEPKLPKHLDNKTA